MTPRKGIQILALTNVVTLAAGRVYNWRYSYIGTDFFSGWTFWTAKDPSKGTVQYVDFTEAARDGLINASATRVYLGVDSSSTVTGTGGRRSVRIESRATFNQGLFVATLDHVPTGCGLWPAFWLYGEDGAHVWPAWGEYDIIEGAHRTSQVMTSLHTNAQCDQSKFQQNLGVKWMPGPLGGNADDCNVGARDQFENQGCSQRGPEGSLGTDFNARGGGTYAAEWDPLAKFIRTWFWPHGLEPPDVVQQRPNPDAWGLPYSYFSLDPTVCSPQHFVNMRMVFDITFCGDLAGPTFEKECPSLGKCEDHVRKHPEHFREAYWSLRRLDVYQHAWFPGARQPFAAFGGAAPAVQTAPRVWWSRPEALVVIGVLLLTIFVLATLLRKKMDGSRCPPFHDHCFTATPPPAHLRGDWDAVVAEGRHPNERPDGVVWGDEGMRIPLHSSSNQHFVFHDPVTGEARPLTPGQFSPEHRPPVGSVKRVVSL